MNATICHCSIYIECLCLSYSADCNHIRPGYVQNAMFPQHLPLQYIERYWSWLIGLHVHVKGSKGHRHRCIYIFDDDTCVLGLLQVSLIVIHRAE